MAEISKIRFIDLKRSPYNESKSDRKIGKYVFDNPDNLRAITKKDYQSADTRHDYVLSWQRYEPSNGYREVRNWQVNRKASFVTIEDPYWPEGVPPTNEGIYTVGDVVLMKVPLLQVVEEMERAREKSEMQSRSNRSAFKSTVAQIGSVVPEGSDVFEEQIKRAFS